MANASKESGVWSSTVEQTTPSKTYTLSTQNKYVDANIELSVNVPSITLSAGQTFSITDPINTWNIHVSSDGNTVTID